MSLVTLVPFALRASVALLVFALGLRVSVIDITHLLRRRRLLASSVVSMNVIMPLFAAAMVALFNLNPAVKVALLALSVSPVPPLLPLKEIKAGGASEFTFSLLVTEALLSIVLVPISVELFEIAFARQAHVSPAAVAFIVLITVLAPLAAGMLVRRGALELADRIAKPVSLVAAVLLVASLIPILFVEMPAVLSLIGNGTLAVIMAFILGGIAAGHLLGGPEPGNRTILALSTASRHPAVALSIASASFPEEKLVLAAVLLYLITNAVVSIPYLIWRRRSIQLPPK